MFGRFCGLDVVVSVLRRDSGVGLSSRSLVVVVAWPGVGVLGSLSSKRAPGPCCRGCFLAAHALILPRWKAEPPLLRPEEPTPAFGWPRTCGSYRVTRAQRRVPGLEPSQHSGWMVMVGAAAREVEAGSHSGRASRGPLDSLGAPSTGTGIPPMESFEVSGHQSARPSPSLMQTPLPSS